MERVDYDGSRSMCGRLTTCALAVVVFASVPIAGAADNAIRIERQFGAEVPQFVEDSFVIRLTKESRRILVVTADAFGPRVSLNELQTVIDNHNVTRLEGMFPGAKPQPVNGKLRDMTGYYRVKLGPGADLDQALAAFARSPHVERAEKIGIHPLYSCATGTPLTPNDTWFDNPPPTFNFPQWDLWDTNGIDADLAWSDETGDPSVIVVGMDSGVRYFHSDLGGPNPPGPADNSTNGNVWVNPGEIPNNGVDDDGNGRIDDVVGWDFVTGNPSLCDSGGGEDCDVQDNDPRDYNGHGTHTGGTMAAISNNASGVAGVAGGFGDGTTSSAGNGCKLMCLRIGWQDILGRGLVRMDYAAEAMQYVADQKNAGQNIASVNCSWGTSFFQPLEDAVVNVLAADVMIIHAAGNSNSSSPDYFGNRAGILNVAATDQNGNKASFSNFGSWVDIAAPGVDIISTWHQFNDPGPNYVAVLAGTSMSAPHVAGVAGLLESCNPSLTRTQKFDILVDPLNTCNVGSPDIGRLLNARLALDAAGCGGCSVPADCDDGNECTIDDCVAGSCTYTPVADDTACTVGGTICCGGTCTTATCSSAADCNDADPCTTATCNNSGTCAASCSNTPITLCVGGDGCCPAGCTPANDSDCSACDNDGVCESGEDCDNCPNDCIGDTGGTPGCDNGTCEPGEDCNNCPQDCRQKTNGNPNNRYCCDGDLPDCGDSRCSEGGFACGPVGGGFCCGQDGCEAGEDSCNCALDCGAPGAEICDNGVDDDCDTLVDCDDTADCPSNQPPCICGGNKDPCSADADCCSNNCKNGSCKGN